LYAIPLVIVAAIVYWLASTAVALLLTHVVDPSLRQAYRDDGTRNRRGYLRSIAAARALGLLGTSAAVYETCAYYAQNNRPQWIAWTIFGFAFATLTARKLFMETTRAIQAR
jgi:hypothetical protein